MKFSVLINNYNYEGFLGAAIESVLAQRFEDFELIVVDDGSTDGSREIIEAFAKRDRRIVPVLKENGGQGSAFLIGIERAQGELLAFLDSDDLWLPHKLERCLEIFESDPSISLLSHAYENIGPKGESVPGRVTPTQTGYFDQWSYYKKLQTEWPYAPTSFMATRRTFAQQVQFDPREWRYAADTPLIAALSVMGKVYTLAEPLGQYRLHRPGNTTGFEGDPVKTLARLNIGPGNYERLDGIAMTNVFTVIHYLFYQAINVQLKRQGSPQRYDFRKSPAVLAIDVQRYPALSLKGLIARLRFRLARL